MSEERMKELLNNIIDYVCVARNTSEQIQILLHMGFEPDELIGYGYSMYDVADVVSDELEGDKCE